MVESLRAIIQDLCYRYDIQVDGFLILYVITFIPSWFALMRFVLSFKKRNLRVAIAWFIVLSILLALPYLYLIFSSKNVPWQFTMALFLIPIYGLLKIVVNREKFLAKKTEQIFWSIYAKVYDLLLYFDPYKQLLRQLVQEIILTKPSGKVVDVGCGTGNLATLLAENLGYTILGLDNSVAMLSRAEKKKYDKQRVSFKQVDLESKNFQLAIHSKFDIGIINNVLYTLKSPITVLSQIKLLLNNDGVLIISEPKQGSSLYTLFKEHYKPLSKHFSFSNFIRSIRDFFALMIIGIFNFVISFRARGRGSYSFFRLNDLTQLVQSAGFKVETVGSSYADQNILLKAKVAHT